MNQPKIQNSPSKSACESIESKNETLSIPGKKCTQCFNNSICKYTLVSSPPFPVGPGNLGVFKAQPVCIRKIAIVSYSCQILGAD